MVNRLKYSTENPSCSLSRSRARHLTRLTAATYLFISQIFQRPTRKMNSNLVVVYAIGFLSLLCFANCACTSLQGTWTSFDSATNTTGEMVIQGALSGYLTASANMSLESLGMRALAKYCERILVREREANRRKVLRCKK